MASSRLIDVVRRTCERARSLRKDARESRWLAQATKAHARQLLALRDPEQTAEPPIEIQPTVKPVRELLEANRQELLAELKQTLCDLETLRMTPQDDPAVRELTADIRKTIAQDAANSPTLEAPTPPLPSFVGDLTGIKYPSP